MREEGLTVSRSGVARHLSKYRQTGSIRRRPGSGRLTKFQKLLVDKEHPLSLQTILRSRSKLGWTFRGSVYCQLIREANMVKRLEWAQKHLQTALQNEFTDVVWTDECTVMLECHRRFCCRKKVIQPKPKPRYLTIIDKLCIYIYIIIIIYIYKYVYNYTCIKLISI